jgi:hypothetical protein
MGVGAALVLVLGAGSIGLFVLWEARFVDTADAGRVADDWARAHTRGGETFERASCSAIFEGERESDFSCPLRFRPSNRYYVVFLRAVDGHTDIRLVRVVRVGANESVTLAPRPER